MDKYNSEWCTRDNLVAPIWNNAGNVNIIKKDIDDLGFNDIFIISNLDNVVFRDKDKGINLNENIGVFRSEEVSIDFALEFWKEVEERVKEELENNARY